MQQLLRRKSHFSAESKHLISPVSVPRKSPTKRVYYQEQFKLFEEQDEIKNFEDIDSRKHLRGIYFRNMTIVLSFAALKLMR